MTFTVFGYGSLVNRRTLPAHLAARPAMLAGWRRAWRASSMAAAGGVCAVSIVPAGDGVIEGLLVTFDGDMRGTIDAREHNYEALPAEGLGGAIVYRARPEVDRWGDAAHPVHLSYVDAIVQGFLVEFGERGVDRFMATTDGWHVPILDDRAAPRYPRAQHLTADEAARVDDALRGVDARILPVDAAPSC
ncbi:gamma-glutamylcyclotransferase family protein [Acuticoccus sp.]|uniref:gamma-glutamylcyclotransferase family protein n=1 Tax=Acuticoccus sp. TaxID=1904378 RepID=UPI003B51A454